MTARIVGRRGCLPRCRGLQWTFDLGVDATVVISAGTALVGALLGSLGAPLLQGRLADRTSLRKERMVLYVAREWRSLSHGCG